MAVGMQWLSCGDIAVRRVLLRVFSAAASSALCTLPAEAHDVSSNELPPVSVGAADHQHPKRQARKKPPKDQGLRNRAAARTDGPTESGPAAGAGTAGPSAALQPTAASATRISGAEV